VWKSGGLGVWRMEGVEVWASGGLGSGEVKMWQSGGLGVWGVCDRVEICVSGVSRCGNLGLCGVGGVWGSREVKVWKSGGLGLGGLEN